MNPRRTKLNHLCVGLTLTIALVVCHPAWCRSLVGMTLPNAEQQDFFNWFHFKENERKAEPDQQTIVSFSTGVNKYSVQLAAIVDKSNDITAMSLVLPRDFINDPGAGVFARDIAKSFLAAAIADADLKSVQSLITEIEFGGQSLKPVQVKEAVLNGKPVADKQLLAPSGELKVGGQAWLGAGTPPAVPAVNSGGYQAYLGKKDEFDQSFSGCSLRMSNTQFPGKLFISVNVKSK